MSAATEAPTISISFGALSPSVADQVARQGYTISDDDADTVKRYGDAILTLYFSDLLTDKEVHAARKRLMRRITKMVRVKG